MQSHSPSSAPVSDIPRPASPGSGSRFVRRRPPIPESSGQATSPKNCRHHPDRKEKSISVDAKAFGREQATFRRSNSVLNVCRHRRRTKAPFLFWCALWQMRLMLREPLRHVFAARPWGWVKKKILQVPQESKSPGKKTFPGDLSQQLTHFYQLENLLPLHAFSINPLSEEARIPSGRPSSWMHSLPEPFLRSAPAE